MKTENNNGCPGSTDEEIAESLERVRQTPGNREFLRLKEIISRGPCLEADVALDRIRSYRLYRYDGYRTFDQWRRA